jgi:hypothetical protein
MRTAASAPVFLPLLGVLCACSIDNPGVAPPAHLINFPIALALSPPDAGEAPDWLFIANSNFDLRYNAGSVQSYDLGDIEAGLGCASPPCEMRPVDLRPSEVLVGSHVAGMAVSPSGERLYLAVRSDTNLTYVNVTDGGLECGGGGAQHRCSDEFRRGDEAVASERGVALPGDPVGVAAGSLEMLGRDPADGDFVLMAHRTGRVSLFLHQREGDGQAPILVHVVTGLPEGLVNIELDPDGFGWAPSTDVAQIARVGVAIDGETRDLTRSFAFDLGTLNVTRVDVGGRGDTRDVAFDPRPDVDRAYVLSRRPEAILVADRAQAVPGDLGVVDVIPIGFGPSRLAVAEIDLAADGSTPDLRTLLFASCFDSREIWVVDPDLGQTVNVIRGLSGPFELAVDPQRKLVYIVDFRSSVIRIADLAPMLACLRDGAPSADASCAPEIVGLLGDPRPVSELL